MKKSSSFLYLSTISGDGNGVPCLKCGSLQHTIQQLRKHMTEKHPLLMNPITGTVQTNQFDITEIQKAVAIEYLKQV